MSGRIAVLVAASLWLASFPTQTGFALEEEEPPPDWSCPNRDRIYVTDGHAELFGLPKDLLCVIAETPLMRDLPTPTESPDLLRRYLRQPPYAALTDNEYITVMQEAITLWPNSRFAHAGLAEAYLGSGHDKSTTVQNKQLAVASFRTAATLAQSQGLTRYIDRVADLYADLGDVENLQGLVNALGSIVHTNYGVAAGLGVACARLNMDSAESLLLSAITLDPGAAAYEYYVNFLFDRNRSQDVLNLLTPEVGTKMMAWLYHAYRCKALANLGRTEEATPECDLANDEPHPGELVAAPSAPPSEEQPKQENDLA